MSHRALLAGALCALLLGAVSPLSAPPTAAAGPPGPVTGRVVGPDGQPLAGVVVRMTAYGERDAAAATTSGADGAFTLPGAERPARFVLVVCANDAACDDVEQATELVKTYVGPDEQAFTLPALHGYFTTDEAGAAPAVDVGDVDLVRPATIEVVDHSGQWFGPNSGPVISGLWRHHDEFTVWRVLAPGTHDVTLGVLHRQVTVGPGERRVVRFGTLPAIAGRVLVGGRPVRGEPVTVTFGTRELRAKTHSDGRYRIGPVPAGVRLRVTLGALGSGQLDPGDTPKRKLWSTLRPGEVRDVSITAPARSRGVIAMSGPFDHNQFVHVQPVGGPQLGVVVARDRAARVGGLTPGRYVVSTAWRTWRSTPDLEDLRADRAVVRVRAGHTTQVRLAPRNGPGEVTLHATPGSYVRLSSAGPDDTSSTGTVPASGDLVITGLPTGAYDVTVARDDNATPSEPVRVQVGADPADVTLPAPPALGSVRVRPVDPDTGLAWPWTAGVVTQLDCGGRWNVPIHDGYFEGGAEPGTFDDCSTWQLWIDLGVPTGTQAFGIHPAEGTLVVRPGEQTTADLAVDLTP